MEKLLFKRGFSFLQKNDRDRSFKMMSRRRTCAAAGTLCKKISGKQRQSRLRSWFSLKRGNRGKNAEQGFTAAIAFVLRERRRFYRHAQKLLFKRGFSFFGIGLFSCTGMRLTNFSVTRMEAATSNRPWGSSFLIQLL